MTASTVTSHVVPSGAPVYAGRSAAQADVYVVSSGAPVYAGRPAATGAAALAFSLASTGVAGVAVAGEVSNSGTAPATWMLTASPAAVITPASGTILPGATVAFSLLPMAANTYSVSLSATGGTVSGSPKSVVVSPAPTVQPAPGAYRTTNSLLFADIVAGTPLQPSAVSGQVGVIETPARVGLEPSYGYLWGYEHGPSWSYIDYRTRWPWVHPGGDWIDTTGTPQATGSPHWQIVANDANSGEHTYTINVTSAVQAVQTGNRWNAYIVQTTGGSRSLASQHSQASAPPSMTVNYTDGSSATLACRACVWLESSSAYTQIGRAEAPTSRVALEFDRPTKAVASASLTVTVTQHTGTSSTIKGYLANPTLTTPTVVPGVAANYPLDVGLDTDPSILVSHRYQDGTTLADWVIPFTPGVSPNVFSRDSWDAEVLGIGGSQPNKLPTAFAGVPYANKWFHKLDCTPNISLVSSTYTGDGFEPPAPGMGALRIVTPGQTAAADGASFGAVGGLGSDLWLLFPKAVCGTEALKRTFVRFKARFATAPKPLSTTKMFREGAGQAVYSVQNGKWGVGVHHWTGRGGNNLYNGPGKGWTNRLGYVNEPAESPVSGTVIFQHTLDNYADGHNLAWGKGGGMGGTMRTHRWYDLEIETDLNTFNPSTGASSADGVVRMRVDGVQVAEYTAEQFRQGPMDPAGAGTDLFPFRDYGPIGLALNHYNGGRLPADADWVVFIAAVACGTSYIGPMAASVPALNLSGINWTPNRDSSGNVLQSDFAQLPVLGGWLEVQGPEALFFNQVETPYYPTAVSGDGYTEIISTWSGMGLNRAAKLGYIWRSGGHGGTNNASNALYQMDFNKLTWSRPLNRTSLANQLSWKFDPGNLTGSLVNEVLNTLWDIPQADNRPGSWHTYDGILWTPPGTPGAGPTKGGLHSVGWCRATLNLDTLENTVCHWHSPVHTNPSCDWSYAAAFRVGNAIYSPRDSAYVAKYDMNGTEATDWSATSAGVLTYTYATNTGNYFERGYRAYCDMAERRECVSISGISGLPAVRLRYGNAVDAGTTNWTAYHDAIQFTSVNGTDHIPLTTRTNFDNPQGFKLQAAGMDYDHVEQALYLQSNEAGQFGLYKITGLSGSTWNVLKLPNSAPTRTAQNGTFGRFRVLRHGSVVMAYRVSGVSHPLQAMRLA